YAVYHLVFPPDSDDGPSECTGVESWNWLGPILLTALRQEPNRFALAIGHLISTRVSVSPSHVNANATERDRLIGFFGDDAAEVIRLIAEERVNTSGTDRDYLDQVVRSAESLLNASASDGHLIPPK